MFSGQITILILMTSIICLLALLLMLGVATRFKNAAGWAALVIAATTVPVYVSYFTLWGSPALFRIIKVTCMVNTLLIPSIWYFVKSNLDKKFRIRWTLVLHLLPAIVSFIVNITYYAQLPIEKVAEDQRLMLAGVNNMPAIINNILFAGQLIYFPFLIHYIRRRMKFLKNNFSSAEYYDVIWMPGFIIACFSLLVIMQIMYVTLPKAGLWLNPLLNLAGMSYLVYCVIRHSTIYFNRLPDMSVGAGKPDTDRGVAGNVSTSTMTSGQMKEICDTVTEYLKSAEVYKNSDLTLSAVALATGIHHKKISTAINGYLHKNFFELINGLRIEEAKRLLIELSPVVYVVESVYLECGFRSRSTFFMTFKKFEGVSPKQWLKGV